MMITRSLRQRAAAAYVDRTVQEHLERAKRESERLQVAGRLLSEILQQSPVMTPHSLPVEIEGLLFDVSLYGEVWRLNLLQYCVECVMIYPTPINDLADLGELIEDGPSYCGQCDC